jgi:hypothetical protein
MLWRKLLQTPFMIKLRNWEYWPFGILQFPIFFYYPWLSLRAGSLTFFSASNPGILMGGMFGESKSDVLKLVQAELTPKSILIRAGTEFARVESTLRDYHLDYPLIFKPDIGERGFMVRRINNNDDLRTYINEFQQDFIVQDLVDLPLEFAVFYARVPSEPAGQVTSVVMKEMLTVQGDGISTLEQLILSKDRAKLQWPLLREKFRGELNTIVPLGKTIEMVSIGNHCLGTKFLNANYLIDEKLTDSFDKISKRIPGFYFGRYDLRCNSIEDLREGKIMILELNGCGAEPAHIYDPDFSFFRAASVLVEHWKTIFVIARENKNSGARYLPLNEAISHYRNFKRKTR